MKPQSWPPPLQPQLSCPKVGPGRHSVFLTPPSIGILETRLRKRDTDAPAVIQKRLAVARHELAQWRHFDYLLISDTIPEDLRRMLTIVEAEKMRSSRATPPEF